VPPYQKVVGSRAIADGPQQIFDNAGFKVLPLLSPRR
jgi:hypothetical protein